MGFNPIYNGFEKKPFSQYFHGFKNGVSFHNLVRDQFSIPVWLMLGALVQGIISFLPYRNILLVAPVVAFIAFRTGRALLQATGILANPYMEGLVHERTAILYADEHGNYEKPGEQEVCAILLAARVNHPLGIFAPGYKELGDRFDGMTLELDKDPTAYGFLGASSWTNSSGRTTCNEQMNFLYFKSMKDLHNYAHGPYHTETMQWWQREAHRLKHIGIMHEVFSAPKHGSEGVYINYQPTGMGATFTEANVNGQKKWMSPLVQGKGKMTYSKGRMGRDFVNEKEWAAFESTLTDVDRV